MLGPILASIGTFFEEIAGSIGKKEVALNQENAYSLAFINLFWAAILFIIIGLVSSRGFVFDLRSLPILALRCSLEIFILYFSIFGIIKADRTTFNFVRTLTIPLLLIVDLLIGYQIDKPAIIGIIIIMTTLLVSFASQKRNWPSHGLINWSRHHYFFV
jgi:hypothetical protein